MGGWLSEWQGKTLMGPRSDRNTESSLTAVGRMGNCIWICCSFWPQTPSFWGNLFNMFPINNIFFAELLTNNAISVDLQNCATILQISIPFVRTKLSFPPSKSFCAAQSSAHIESAKTKRSLKKESAHNSRQLTDLCKDLCKCNRVHFFQPSSAWQHSFRKKTDPPIFQRSRRHFNQNRT